MNLRIELEAWVVKHEAKNGQPDCVQARDIRAILINSQAQVVPAEPSEFRFTDEEWRKYQEMPDQGYSHRHHLEHVVNRWLKTQAQASHPSEGVK